MVDGTLIAIDRVAADKPFYSGKPGSVHDKKAEWTWGVLGELEAAGLIVLADKRYQGSWRSSR